MNAWWFVAFNWFQIKKNFVGTVESEIEMDTMVLRKISNQMSDSRIRHRGREWPMKFIQIKVTSIESNWFCIYFHKKLTCYYKCYLNGIFSSNFIDFYIFDILATTNYLLIVFKCNFCFIIISFFLCRVELLSKSESLPDSRV